MVKKAVLFDLDNTLYDYDAPNKKSYRAVHSILNKYIKISYPKFIKLLNASKAEIQRELSGTASSHNRVLYFQRLIEKTHKTIDPMIILKLYNAYWDTLLKNMKLRSGVIKVLKELKRRGIKIAIVSDLTTNIQLRKIERLKITDYVDFLVTSEEAGSEKPHSIMFLLALKKLDILPRDAIMVGDNTINDISGANAVGIDTVLIKKGKLAKKAKEDTQKPDYIIRNISELIDIIRK